MKRSGMRNLKRTNIMNCCINRLCLTENRELRTEIATPARRRRGFTHERIKNKGLINRLYYSD